GRDVVFGPTGWLLTAAAGTASLLVAPPNLLWIDAVVIAASCAVFALLERPFYIRRYDIVAHFMAARHESEQLGASNDPATLRAVSAAPARAPRALPNIDPARRAARATWLQRWEGEGQ